MIWSSNTRLVVLMACTLASSGCGAAAAVKALGTAGAAGAKVGATVAPAAARVTSNTARVTSSAVKPISRAGTAATVNRGARGEKSGSNILQHTTDAVQFMIPSGPSSDSKKR